ncbi:MAG: hypothetical protein QM770_01540 [Tepidisphaeraceae bacterium]
MRYCRYAMLMLATASVAGLAGGCSEIATATAAATAAKAVDGAIKDAQANAEANKVQGASVQGPVATNAKPLFTYSPEVQAQLKELAAVQQAQAKLAAEQMKAAGIQMGK